MQTSFVSCWTREALVGKHCTQPMNQLKDYGVKQSMLLVYYKQLFQITSMDRSGIFELKELGPVASTFFKVVEILILKYLSYFSHTPCAI